MKYAYFNNIDGRVLQWLDTNTQSYNLPDNSLLYECTEIEWGLDHSLDWMISNNAIVTYIKPSSPILSLKNKKILEINSSFLAELQSGFTTTSGIKMDADITDIQFLKSAYDLYVLLGLTVFPILVNYDNAVYTDMPMSDVLKIIIETAVNYQTLYAKKQALRGQAMSATTANEINLISWI